MEKPKKTSTITSEWLTKIALSHSELDDLPNPMAGRPTGKIIREVWYNGGGKPTVIVHNRISENIKRIWKALFNK